MDTDQDTELPDWITVTSARHPKPSTYPKWVRPYTIGGHTGDHALVVLSIATSGAWHDRQETAARLAVTYGSQVQDVTGPTGHREIGTILLAGHLAALDVHASLGDYPTVADDVAEVITGIFPATTWPRPEHAEARRAAGRARKSVNAWVDNPATLHRGLKHLLIMATGDADVVHVALHHLLRDTARAQIPDRTRLPDLLDRLVQTQ
jgi:hypothetical protein